MKLLRRKTDKFLKKWRENENRMPLIVKGARQIGKTASIMQFTNSNYKNVVAINFVLQQKYKAIFDEGYDVDSITRALTFIDPFIKLEQGNTLIFFDEMQDCPACAISLKAFKIDERYDVICSSSLMGINYREIESNSVGYKEDYTMHSMDFEVFL
ncbi:ATP-binding protein [Segatella copri]|uniref:ATP-binding protein n=1 Tax=Prevotellaceae TaxID=171552 RepID=UPI00222E44BE|nr:AAA family ATPase [Segatella copri]MCW4083573.1 AAA family ATPase [Segatella copri]